LYFCAVLAKGLILILFLLFFLGEIKAQKTASTDSLLFVAKKEALSTDYKSLLNLKDTFVKAADKLATAQRQVTARRDLISYQDLGTHYSPLMNLVGPVSFSTGFTSGNNALNYYKFGPEKQSFYKASMPFTSFRYAQGGQRYIQFQALHTQNIIPTWNIAAGISSFTNEGYGLRQFQSHRAPFFNSHFTLPNNRFRTLVAMNWVNRTGQESGGLSTDYFTTSGSADTFTAAGRYPNAANGPERNALPMGLSNAYDTAKLTHHRFLYQYHLGQKKQDTLDSIYKVDALFAIGYLFDYQRERWIYQDNSGDSAFYENFQNYSKFQQNRDSQVFRVITNEVYLKKLQRRASGFAFGGRFGIESYHYNQNQRVNIDGINSYIGGSLEGIFAEKILLTTQVQYYISGYNQHDYKLDANAILIQKYFTATAFVKSSLKEPEVVQKYFNSPYYQYYRTNLSKTLSNNLGLQIQQKNRTNPIDIVANIQNINNYIYFDKSFTTQQLNSAVQILTLKLAKVFTYKTLNAGLNGFVQQASSSALPLPKWGGKLDLYYKKHLFDSALHFKTGIDIFTYAKHNAYGYKPVLRQFYVNDMQQLGQYPLVDLYVSGKIKTLIFFVKMENVMNALTKAVPYSTQNYPIQTMALRVGLLWDFYF